MVGRFSRLFRRRRSLATRAAHTRRFFGQNPGRSLGYPRRVVLQRLMGIEALENRLMLSGASGAPPKLVVVDASVPEYASLVSGLDDAARTGAHDGQASLPGNSQVVSLRSPAMTAPTISWARPGRRASREHRRRAGT